MFSSQISTKNGNNCHMHTTSMLYFMQYNGNYYFVEEKKSYTKAQFDNGWKIIRENPRVGMKNKKRELTKRSPDTNVWNRARAHKWCCLRAFNAEQKR